MGRTISKFGDDEDDRRKKSTKSLKHSKNIPGQGMRVINNWSEEDYDTYDNSDLDYEYNDYTSQTQRKHKGNTNGY
jgi:hypothetical protein